MLHGAHSVATTSTSAVKIGSKSFGPISPKSDFIADCHQEALCNIAFTSTRYSLDLRNHLRTIHLTPLSCQRSSQKHSKLESHSVTILRNKKCTYPCRHPDEFFDAHHHPTTCHGERVKPCHDKFAPEKKNTDYYEICILQKQAMHFRNIWPLVTNAQSPRQTVQTPSHLYI